MSGIHSECWTSRKQACQRGSFETHLTLVPHICVAEQGQHVWRQAITWTNVDLSLIGPLETNFSGNRIDTWWRDQMETFSALLATCAGNSTVSGEFPAQRPLTWSFDVFLDLRPNKRLSKHWWGWWFETPSYPLWRQCNYTKLPNHQNASENVVWEMSIIL